MLKSVSSVLTALKSAAWGSREPSVVALKSLIGADNFYVEVAKFDPEHAAQWLSMVEVQRRFKLAEPSYRTDEARVYSESNRETLHRLAIALLERSRTTAYRDFIELHPTLFAENGACELPPDEQLFIFSKTHPDMFRGVTFRLLLKGIVLESKWTELVHYHAELTRAHRRAEGLAVTMPSGLSRPELHQSVA